MCSFRILRLPMSRSSTLVTSLSKSLAHQASLCASHTAFMVLKRRHFYLSHLPAYFSDTNKRSMLSAPAVCADYLFAEADVARLLSDMQTASSLKSQQALVDVVRALVVRLLASLWGAAAGSLVFRLVVRSGFVLTPLLLAPL